MRRSTLPLLENYIEKKKQDVSEIFSDKCFVIVLHFLRDLMPFLNGLRKLGAKPQNCWVLAKPYPYPYKELIRDALLKDEFKVKVPESYPIKSVCQEVFHSAYLHAMRSQLDIIIIEDGGHIAPHTVEISNKKLLAGAIEQTTKGFWKYKEMEEKGKLSFPVLSVASSKFKSDYEPRFIGQTVVKNICKFLPDAHLAGKKALVFGYGSIGSMVAHYLRSMEGMNVDVCEVDPKKRILAKFDNFNVKSNIKEFGEKEWYLVVGCTGGKRKNGEEMATVDEEVISLLPHGCILVSASSDQVEIDVRCLERLSQDDVETVYLEEAQHGTSFKIKVGSRYRLRLLRRTQTPPEITLLADGYPINFYSSESVPNESIDPIMTTIFLSTVCLAERYKDLEKGVLDKVVDEIIEKEKMLETFSRLHGLD